MTVATLYKCFVFFSEYKTLTFIFQFFHFAIQLRVHIKNMYQREQQQLLQIFTQNYQRFLFHYGIKCNNIYTVDPLSND